MAMPHPQTAAHGGAWRITQSSGKRVQAATIDAGYSPIQERWESAGIDSKRAHPHLREKRLGSIISSAEEQQMRIRLEHHEALEGRYHVFTSPDLKGFHVTGETLEDAKREAFAMIDLIQKARGAGNTIPTAIEFDTFEAA